jgi:hypothetical protein
MEAIEGLHDARMLAPRRRIRHRAIPYALAAPRGLRLR